MSMRQPLKHALQSTGMSNPDDVYELDEAPQVPPRVDAPVKLETRGTTSQEVDPQNEVNGKLHQFLLWAVNTLHKNEVAYKLHLAGLHEEGETLQKCHTIYTIAQCKGCAGIQKFPNRCDNFFCPECQPRISNDRKKAVSWWVREVQQPKHVVLTVKNVPDLTKAHVQEFRSWWTKLRRSKFARNWEGGFYSLEVTNEGRGWHLHLHALVNAGWIDQFQLSEKWSKITNGMGRIVKARDARQINYLAEVTKYVVKGSMLAAWTPDQIAAFVNAFRGVRTFGVFGSLFGVRTKFAEWWKAIRNERPACKCGCNEAHYFTEAQFMEKDFVAVGNVESIPPPRFDDQTLTFNFVQNVEFGPR